MPSIIKHGNTTLKEFPISIKQLGNHNLVYTGGGYFRLCPYFLIKYWAKQQEDHLLLYIHPRDLDAGQPMIKELPLLRKFKSYVGLKGAEQKLRQMLTDFQFIDIGTANSKTDWDKAPIVTIQ